jgi:hypothetical protein
MNLEESVEQWITGNSPKNRKDEDEMLLYCAKKYNINCKINPGKMAEKVISEKLKKLGKNITEQKCLECHWLCGQKTIKPDIITDDIIFEIKSMRYFDGKGRRGGQGSAPEKIDSVFRKYSGCKKPVIVVLCGDMQNDRNGKIFLEAFQTQNFNDNKVVKVLYETFKESIMIISYKNIEKYLL